MTKEELQNIITQFDEDSLKKQGIFSLQEYGPGPGEVFIKANKEGLEIFALQLLKSAIETEDIIINQNRKTIILDKEESWFDEFSDVIIQHIEPIKDKSEVRIKEEYKESFTEKAIPFGCILLIILLITALVIGFITIVKWLI